MLEIAMVTALAGMGFYFFKSTDLPKDLKERSAQNRASQNYVSSAPKKFAMPKVNLEMPVTNKEIAGLPTMVNLATVTKIDIKESLEAQKLFEMKKQEKEIMIALHNQKIDELTLLITTLEQQIKENNSRNAEIQAQINLHLESLKTLKETKIA